MKPSTQKKENLQPSYNFNREEIIDHQRYVKLKKSIYLHHDGQFYIIQLHQFRGISLQETLFL